MDYMIVIEKGERNYSGYPLDIEGIYAFGPTEADVAQKLEKAIADRIAELRAEGKEVPEPAHTTRKVHIA